MTNYKAKLAEMRLSQSELILHLREKYHESIDPGEFSKIINGILDTPKADRIRAEIDEVIRSWQKKSS